MAMMKRGTHDTRKAPAVSFALVLAVLYLQVSLHQASGFLQPHFALHHGGPQQHLQRFSHREGAISIAISPSSASALHADRGGTHGGGWTTSERMEDFPAPRRVNGDPKVESAVTVNGTVKKTNDGDGDADEDERPTTHHENHVFESTVGQVCVIPVSEDYESPNDQVSTSLYHRYLEKDHDKDQDRTLFRMAFEETPRATTTETLQHKSSSNSSSTQKPKFVFSEDPNKISSSNVNYKSRDASPTTSFDYSSPPANPTMLVDSYSTRVEQQHDTLNRLIENIMIYVPIAAPLVAYNTFTNISWLYTQFVGMLSQSRWAEVDGGMYSTKILTPAINGIVVPSVSILFATLVSSTVTTLRIRQLDIRTSLNKEANNLRMLQSMIDSFPIDIEADMNEDAKSNKRMPKKKSSNNKNSKAKESLSSSFSKRPQPTLSDYQDKCRDYLTQYVVRLIAESQEGANINTLEYTGSVDSEMNALIVQLNELATRQSSSSSSSSMLSTNMCNVPTALLGEAYSAVAKLNEDRSIRISALQSTFPPLHYVLIALMGSSILTTFLIESAEAPNLFLNEVQLQLLWTILIGTFSALSTVLYDLSDPFRGSYQISGCRRQLYTIRDSLKASTKLKEQQQRYRQNVDKRAGEI
jgi:hypothetical protein